MTDQSNPPRPPRTPSLFERAGDSFGIKGFAPAPVPERLQPLPSARNRPRPASETPELRSPAPVPMPPAPAPIPQGYEPEPAPAPQPVRAPEPPRAVRFGGPVFKVDRKHLFDNGFIVPGGSVTRNFEEFRIVKRKLMQVAQESLAGRAPAHGQCVLVCSPHPGEGKTFCAVNLALAMAAERDSEVLLVDADFAHPSVPPALGLPTDRPGLMDVLRDSRAAVEDCVLATDVPGLFVLPAGRQHADDSEYLASQRTGDVLDRLTRGAPNRMVIFDSAPALAATQAAELARHVGQVLLVARADQTGRSALEDAVSLLSQGQAEVSLLLNAAQFSPSGRRFGSYYNHGGQP